MKAEYEAAFIKHFGKIVDGTFFPPTSRSYAKISELLGHRLDSSYSIPIETFHEPQGNSALTSRGASQLQVTLTELSEARERYQSITNERGKKEFIKEFWATIVYPKALDIWNTQTVMEVTNADLTPANNLEKLKFTVLEKNNPEDKWGSDYLGNASDE